MVTDNQTEDDYVYKSDYSNTTELLDSIEDLGERMSEEGTVLLKNNGALPLSADEKQKVTFLGFSSYFPIQGGDFGSTLTENKGTDADTVDMVQAFEAKGYSLNPTVQNMYLGMKEDFTMHQMGRLYHQVLYAIVYGTLQGLIKDPMELYCSLILGFGILCTG